MAQASTKQLLVDLGGEAQEHEIIRLAKAKGLFDPLVEIQGLINRDLRNLEKWGEVTKIAKGRWKIKSEKR